MRVLETIQFFDSIAEKWDSWENLPELHQKFQSGFDEFGVKTGETILDIGCGTGNLSLSLLDSIGKDGRIHALDISPKMIEIARRKISDPRTTWHVGDAASLPLPDGSMDRVFCCSVWPHFNDHSIIVREIRRVLRNHGTVHVWHLISRARINSIHRKAGEQSSHSIQEDVLKPAAETAGFLVAQGFTVTAMADDEHRYLVSAYKGNGADNGHFLE
jgi:demethylmenaquinone methyltransferase/2-methoxy-6-polyprenyl-1,4-benzoquinol methylase